MDLKYLYFGCALLLLSRLWFLLSELYEHTKQLYFTIEPSYLLGEVREVMEGCGISRYKVLDEEAL